ncbi:hypothetical protein OS493_002740 [Desmophyllum pertusum]|uniref:Uncharacterized protein n=1 Tax=Desmophyllum pertusum TaxID=174260 RepID=A0A9X0CP94_9CNID|nr:hypothetical protein OS493_002740 [Desmophyllum pertusum]
MNSAVLFLAVGLLLISGGKLNHLYVNTIIEDFSKGDAKKQLDAALMGEKLHDDMCKDLLESATYETHTLMEIIYDSACQPKGWEGFFNRERRQDNDARNLPIASRNDSQVQGLGLNPKIGWIFQSISYGFHLT